MAHIVDMRSDTVTKPTEAMKHAMVNSALGDDVFGDDPTVIELENTIAATMGKQAGLFVPSGTMGNLISIMVHCSRRGSEVILGDKSHIFKYEQGNAAQLAGVQLHPVGTLADGTLPLAEVERRVRSGDIHEPVTCLVAIESTHNVCGGKALPVEYIDSLGSLCKRHSLPLHMDGARIFNACEKLQLPPARVVAACDSVSVCFSKGLSAPVGSALVGDYHFIQKARRCRKALGGGLRQAGVLCAAALVSLTEVVPLLARDHKRAGRLALVIDGLQLKSFSVDVEGTHTNIVLLKISADSDVTADTVVQRLAQVCREETQGDCKTPNDEGVIIKCIAFDTKTVRFTLHREIDDEALWLAIMKITYVLKEFDNML